MKQFEAFALDTANGCLWRGSQQIMLPPKPFDVLRYLVENPGRLVTHDELLDALWPETYVQPQVLRTYVLELRKLLGDDAVHPRFIQTLPKRGYCFVAAVTDRPGAAHAPAVAKAGRAEVAAIVGRETELARLRSVFEEAAGSVRRTLFVAGETGIGKTALVDAFCREAASSGAAIVARGQCVEGVGSRERYYPVMEALGQLCDSSDGETACHTLARFAPAWLMRLDRQTLAVDWAAVPLSGHGRMPGDLCRALEELAGAKPLILAFEDLHWADNSTLELLSALARRRAQAKLLVVATYVPGIAASGQPIEDLKRDLLIHQCGSEIMLGALPRRAVEELLARKLHQATLPAGLAEFVHSHSEGNPLFALAVLDHLVTQRCLVFQDIGGEARWEERVPFGQIDSALPHELLEMIELEIAQLNGEEQSMLEAASLLPVAFPAWAVAAALEKDPAETEEACNRLARRLRYVARAGEDELPDGSRSAFYAFTHGLYREVLYRRQAASRRARRHMGIAEALGRYFAGREADVAREMAMHFEAAGDWQRATAALRAAAHSAHQRGARHHAAELLESALRLAQNLGGAERDAEAEAIRRQADLARRADDEKRTDKRENPSGKNLTIS